MTHYFAYPLYPGLAVPPTPPNPPPCPGTPEEPLELELANECAKAPLPPPAPPPPLLASFAKASRLLKRSANPLSKNPGK